MPVQFQTLAQQMLFVDPSPTPPQPVSPGSLTAGKTYDVYLVLKNTDATEALGVVVTVTHGPFGIGIPGGTTYLIQPAPVDLPPMYYGVPGQATVSFKFTAPTGGHGCLVATIQPNGPSLQQNVTVLDAPRGVSSMLSFLVYGDLSKVTQMKLALTETGPGPSWKPLLVAPPGLCVSTAPTAAPITVTLAADTVYSIGLQVSIPAAASAPHTFQIVGSTLGPQNVETYAGEVSITVQPQQSNVPPDIFIAGPWHSPDILLYTAQHQLVPIGGAPDGDTLLFPNMNYDLYAVVHNQSPTPAANTVVRFWYFDFGLSCSAHPIDVQTVTVPGNGQIAVHSAKPFRAAPSGRMRCIGVTIFNPQSVHCQTDYATGSEVLANGIPPYSFAGRNCDSMRVYLRRPFQFLLGFDPLPQPHPGVRIEIAARYVAPEWLSDPQVQQVQRILPQVGMATGYPLYLIGGLTRALPAADLGVNLPPHDGGSIERAQTGFLVKGAGATPTEFVVSGKVPASAKPGDIYTVTVTAHYPATGGTAARDVEFLEILHVSE